MTDRQPIFFAFTKSFWLTTSAIGLLLFGDMELLQSFVEVLAPVFGLDPLPLMAWFRKAAPAALFMFALHQRSGAARPYSTKIKDK